MEFVCIGIFVWRLFFFCSIVWECFVVFVVVCFICCCVVVINYLEEELEVLDIDIEKKEEEKVKEEVNFFILSVFEVWI